MKKHILVPIVFGGLITFSLTTQAQDRPGQGGRGGEGGRGEANPREGIREAMIKKFDKNGDGKLDEKERPTREQLQEFFRAQLGGGRTPGGRPGGGEGRPGGGEGRPGGGEGRPGGGEGRPGGRPGEGGRGGGFDREGMRAAMLKKFDKNGDGRLDEDERPSREEMQEFFRSQGGGGRPGQGGAGGRPGEGRPGEGRPGEGGRPGQGGQDGRPDFGSGRPMNPVMVALDANKDGEISAEELKNATAALSKLDKNKDGKLTREEMRPQFDRGQGGREGFNRPGQGGQGGREGGFNPGRRPGGDRPDRPDDRLNPGQRPDRPGNPGGFDRRPREGQPGQRPGGDRPGRPTRPERPNDNDRRSNT